MVEDPLAGPAFAADSGRFPGGQQFEEKAGKFPQPAVEILGRAGPVRVIGQQVGIASEMVITGGAGGEDGKIMAGKGRYVLSGQPAGLFPPAGPEGGQPAAALVLGDEQFPAAQAMKQGPGGTADPGGEVAGQAAAEITCRRLSRLCRSTGCPGRGEGEICRKEGQLLPETALGRQAPGQNLDETGQAGETQGGGEGFCGQQSLRKMAVISPGYILSGPDNAMAGVDLPGTGGGTGPAEQTLGEDVPVEGRGGGAEPAKQMQSAPGREGFPAADPEDRAHGGAGPAFGALTVSSG